MAKKPPAISIYDEYKINPDKTAACKRIYTLTNQQNTPIKLAANEHYIDNFHLNTTNHKINDAPAGKHNLDTEVLGFNKICYWQPSKIKLQPHDFHKVTLSYDWPDFLTVSNEVKSFTIPYHQPHTASYSLKIIPYKEDFFNEISFACNIVGAKHKILKTGELLFGPVELSNVIPQVEVNVKIERTIDINRELQLLKFRGSQVTDNPFKDYIIIMVQHLLGDFIPFINTLETCGVKSNNCYIIGIPYSTKGYVVDALKNKKGYKNVRAPKEYPFENDIRGVLKKIIDKCENDKRGSKRFLVIEDGGYIVPMLHGKEFRKGLKYCIGAVEQTTNGIWRDKDLAKERRLKIPVMNVAESELKKTLEGRLIGDAVVGNIKRLLKDHYRDGVFQKNCFVNGLGDVGLRIALTLKNAGAKVSGYDTKKTIMSSAKKKGIKIGNEVSMLIRNQAIVIGGTGRSPLGFKAIISSQHNTVFVNATSKREEINYKELDGLTKKIEPIDGVGSKCHLTIGKTILLLADGYPVNFFDSESVPDNEIQFVPTLLFEASILLLSKKYNEPKVYSIPKKLQDEIKYQYIEMRKAAIDIN